MLQGGGVEDQLRLDLGEQALDARLVPHIGEDGSAQDLGVFLAQLEIDLIKNVFAMVEQGERGGTQGRNLARQFAADGPPRAGHQHAAALHQPRHPLSVQRHLRSVQEFLDRDGAQLLARQGAGIQRGRGRRAANGHAVMVGGVHQLLQRDTLHARVCEHDGGRQPVLGAELVQDHLRLLDQAQNWVALNAATQLAFAQRQDANDTPARCALLRQRPDEQVRAIARTRDQDGLRGIGAVIGGAPRAEAAGHTRGAKQGSQSERVDRREGKVGRAPGCEGVAGGPEQCRRQHCGSHDTQQLAQAGEAPVLARQPEGQPGEEQHGNRGGNGREPPGARRPGAGCRKPKRYGQRQAGDQAIEAEVEQNAIRSGARHGAAIEQRRGGGNAAPPGKRARFCSRTFSPQAAAAVSRALARKLLGRVSGSRRTYPRPQTVPIRSPASATESFFRSLQMKTSMIFTSGSSSPP